MSRPIPARILKDSATVRVCTALDLYQNQAYETYSVARVHLQAGARVEKSPGDTLLPCVAVLFADARLSRPDLDWAGLLKGAHELGGDMRVTVNGETYTVTGAQAVPDDRGRPHHWEISLA